MYGLSIGRNRQSYHLLSSGGRDSAGPNPMAASSFMGGGLFNIAGLNLSGLWLPNYTGSPWVDNPSAGSSGTNNLTEGTNPPTQGTAVNGFIPAHFNGTNQVLTGPGTDTSYFGIGSYSVVYLVKVNSFTVADPGAALPYSVGQILADGAGSLNHGGPSGGIAGTGSSGVFRFGHFDGAWKSSATSISVGSWMMLAATFNGSVVGTSLNNGPVTSTATGAVSQLVDTLNIGSSAAQGGGFPAIDLMMGMTSKVCLQATDLTNIYSYMKTRFPSCGLP